MKTIRAKQAKLHSYFVQRPPWNNHETQNTQRKVLFYCDGFVAVAVIPS